MKMQMGADEVTVEVEGDGRVWFHTGEGRSMVVSVEDAMALVHELTGRMPVFSNETFDNVRLDIRTYEAKKEGEAVFQKVSKLGVEYLGRDAAHLTEGELKLLHRLLDAEGER